MKIIQKAERLLDACSEIVLCSLTEYGHPRPCVLSKTKTDGIRLICCATGLSGVKVRQFQANPKAGLCFWKGGDSVTLTGTVAVKTDIQTKEAQWLDWFIDHFPGGTKDPNYCILEFCAEEATLWIEGEFVTVQGDAL